MEKEIQDYPGKWYQPLFDLMYNQHGLILLGSEMDEVISVVKEMIEEKEALNPSSDSKRAPGGKMKQLGITGEDIIDTRYENENF